MAFTPAAPVCAAPLSSREAAAASQALRLCLAGLPARAGRGEGAAGGGPAGAAGGAGAARCFAALFTSADAAGYAPAQQMAGFARMHGLMRGSGRARGALDVLPAYGCFMVACKYSGSCSLPLRDLSLLAARERMMREAGALLAGAAGGDAAARVAGWGADAAADAGRLRGAEEAVLAAVGSGAWDIDRTGELDALEGTLLDALEGTPLGAGPKGTPLGAGPVCGGDAAADARAAGREWTRAPPDASPRAREAFAAAQRQRNECVSGAFARARPRARMGLDPARREVLKLLRVSGVVAIQNIVDHVPEMQTRAMMHAMLLWCEYVEACGAALAEASSS